MDDKRKETALGLVFFEKISGLILLIVGIILSSYTYVNRGDLGAVTSIFLIIVGIIVAFLGLLMFIVKGE